MSYKIGLDLGGTHIKGVLIQSDEIIRREQRSYRQDDQSWQQAALAVYRILSEQAGDVVNSVGLAAPGIAAADNRSIAHLPGRLPGVEQFDWSAFLGREVSVLNDAHAALWAEACWGVGKDRQHIVLLTLGTGVGGGLLLNGQLYQGFLQRAGHLGHMSVDVNSTVAGITGTIGSLEEGVGEASLQRRSLGRFTTTYELVEAYRAGDTWATFVWLDSVRKLALGIVSCFNAFSPELVILAGGITKAGEHLLEPLTSFIDLYEWRPGGHSTPIVIAQFEEYAGAIGAALYAEHHI